MTVYGNTLSLKAIPFVPVSPQSRMGRAALYQRHDYVWVDSSHLHQDPFDHHPFDPDKLEQKKPGQSQRDQSHVRPLPLAQIAGTRHRHLIVQSDLETGPLVVTRRSQEDVAHGLLRLGLCMPSPDKNKPIRMAFSCPEAAVISHRPALLLEEVESGLHQPLPVIWSSVLRDLAELQSEFEIPFRVYGSVAWDSLFRGSERFIRQSSDLDLLLCLPHGMTQERLQELLDALYRLSLKSEAEGGPSLDGELRHESWGDLSWREMRQVMDQPERFKILSKGPDSVRLVDLNRTQKRIQSPAYSFHPEQLDLWAIEALTAEALAWPKPGLVSPIDSGSHDDMDIHLLLRAIQSLKLWFAEFARAAQAGAEFKELAAIGRAAEAVMMRATLGVNVYRGAIFNMGLLVAAAALCSEAEQVTRLVANRWGDSILAHRPPTRQHGTQLRMRLGKGGALKEAAEGFPVLTHYALPAYLNAFHAGYQEDRCLIASLMASMVHLEDTNLLWRGGDEGLAWAQEQGKDFVGKGGIDHPKWLNHLSDLHEQFKTKRLSPGGSADIAACAFFLGRLTLCRDSQKLRHAT